jgi:alpha-beta hydrolase superfamily lysophospholipase
VKQLAEKIAILKAKQNITEHHMVCHSQGALICRAYLMEYQHTCQTFISLTGPQMGTLKPNKILKNRPIRSNTILGTSHSIFTQLIHS